MVTRIKKVEEAIPLPDGWEMKVAPPTEPEDDESPADRVVEMLRGSMGAERAAVKLYRLSNTGEEFCTEYSPGDFEQLGLDGVRKEWGSGQYAIRLYATNPETGKFARRASQTVKIADAPRRLDVVAPAPTQNTELVHIFESIQKNQEMMLRALTERPPAPDPMSEMTKMLSMMTMMREAMGLNSQPQQKSSIGEIVEAIKELKSAKSLIDNEPEEKEETLTSMIPQVLEVIKTGMTQQQQQQPPADYSVPVVTLPPSLASMPVEMQAQPHPQPQSQSEQEDEQMLILKLLADKRHIQKFIDDKKTPLEAATWIHESASDELIALIAEDQWFEALSNVMAEAKTHEVWLKATRAIVMQKLKDDGYFDEVAAPE